MTETGFKSRLTSDFKTFKMFEEEQNIHNPSESLSPDCDQSCPIKQNSHTFLSFSTLALNLERSIKKGHVK